MTSKDHGVTGLWVATAGGLEGEGDRSLVRLSKEKHLKAIFSARIYDVHYLCLESFMLTESGQFLMSSTQRELTVQLLSLIFILTFSPVQTRGWVTAFGAIATSENPQKFEGAWTDSFGSNHLWSSVNNLAPFLFVHTQWMMWSRKENKYAKIILSPLLRVWMKPSPSERRISASTSREVIIFAYVVCEENPC